MRIRIERVDSTFCVLHWIGRVSFALIQQNIYSVDPSRFPSFGFNKFSSDMIQHDFPQSGSATFSFIWITTFYIFLIHQGFYSIDPFRFFSLSFITFYCALIQQVFNCTDSSCCLSFESTRFNSCWFKIFFHYVDSPLFLLYRINTFSWVYKLNNCAKPR